LKEEEEEGEGEVLKRELVINILIKAISWPASFLAVNF